MRITKKKLNEYNQQLTKRDKAVLHSIKMCKFMKTNQVARLHFSGATTPSASLRATTRNLTKLRRLGLIQPLERDMRWFGVRSTSFVWTIKTAGIELLRLGENTPPVRVRKHIFEPTYIFLKHTLAVAELYVQLCTKTNLVKCEFEPNCWRSYTTDFGVNVTLKPDLYAVVATGGYENHYFFEVDLDTEAPSRIMQKCERYGRYYLTGIEQKQNGVFPKVAWIVPDNKRKESLCRHIREHLSEYADLFVVTTFEELDSVIFTGIIDISTDKSTYLLRNTDSIKESRP
ncbi:MAG: replication-relaxation family protein [Oscillospiraceae bacterium]|nr:replication-relaxation family protein [Oscillospiraceae bacterium]